MSSTRFIGLLSVSLVAACASVEQQPSKTTAAPAAVVAAVDPPATADAPTETLVAVPEPVSPSVSAPIVASPAKTVSEPVAAVAKPPVKVAAPAVVAQSPKQVSTPAVASTPKGPPPLDLKSLEAKLKETKAIGVFTKLSLKGQVDDLLKQFRAYYNGQNKTTITELRQPYDTLMLKVLTLLQDGDPPLAREISTSREAIWGVLADPVKFSSL
jgi:hypothetical protein